MKNRKSGETVGAFCTWMRSVGISYTRDAIDIVGTSPGTLSIVAVDDVPEEVILASIPKEACITVRTTKISDILEEEGLAGGLGLVISVWYEKRIGKASRWSGYFDSLLDREELPIFWGEKEMALLQGTEIQPATVESDRDDVLDDYRGHVMPLVEKYPDAFGQILENDESLFVDAASLVASRAFGVDDIHGDGMVPLADVFNHKVSVVELSEEYTIHGAEGESERDEESERSSSSSTSSRSDVSARFPQPCARQADHVLERCGMSLANGLNLRLHIAIIDDSRNDSLQIMCASPLSKGEEVFNTYGELGNADLVKKYGFCLPENPFTYVTLRKECILKEFDDLFVSGHPGKRTKGPVEDDGQLFQNLCSIMRDQTELLSDQVGEEPFLLYPEGYVSLTVYVFITLVILGMCDVDIGNVEDALSLNADLMAALDASIPVSFEQAVRESSKIVSCSKERVAAIATMCVKALGASARERREVSEKIHPTKASKTSSAAHVAETLRSSEQCILHRFIEITETM
jgi:N-lysine methyltransferase SETD6